MHPLAPRGPLGPRERKSVSSVGLVCQGDLVDRGWLPALGRFEVLRERNFRLFFLGHLTSLIGRSMTPVALTFAVLHRGGSVSGVGLVLMAKAAPLVAFVLLGGAVGDRLPRKAVMLTTDVVRCASQGGLAAWLLLGHPAVWQIMVLAAVIGLGVRSSCRP